MPSITLDKEIDWVKLQMPRVQKAVAALPDVSGVKIASCTHIEIKMVPAFEALVERGAELYLTTCNPHTVKNEVVERLSKKMEVEAWNGMNDDAWQKSKLNALSWSPSHLCEMGADFSQILANSKNSLKIRGSIEATSSGISLLEKMDLKYPVFNWNNVSIKEHLHNRRMVGITTWHTFYERTRLTLHEKRVAVIGYGAVGKSVADAAKAYGGNVCIVERDQARALEAVYASWNVVPMEEAMKSCDVIVTATGARKVLSENQFKEMKDGVFLLNVGHINNEIDIEYLSKCKHHSVLPHVEEYSMKNKTIYLFAGGHMANLAAGFGDSLNAFDVSMAIMVAALGFSVESAGKYKSGLHPLPREVWESII